MPPHVRLVRPPSARRPGSANAEASVAPPKLGPAMERLPPEPAVPGAAAGGAARAAGKDRAKPRTKREAPAAPRRPASSERTRTFLAELSRTLGEAASSPDENRPPDAAPGPADDATAAHRAAFRDKMAASETSREEAREALIAHLRRLEEVSAPAGVDPAAPAPEPEAPETDAPPPPPPPAPAAEAKAAEAEVAPPAKPASRPVSARPTSASSARPAKQAPRATPGRKADSAKPQTPAAQPPTQPPTAPPDAGSQALAILKHYGASEDLLANVADDAEPEAADALTEDEALWLARAEELLGLQGSSALPAAPAMMDFYPDFGEDIEPAPAPSPPPKDLVGESDSEARIATIAELRGHVDDFLGARGGAPGGDAAPALSREEMEAEEAELAELGKDSMLSTFHALVDSFTADALEKRHRLFRDGEDGGEDGTASSGGDAPSPSQAAAANRARSAWDDPEVQKGLRKIARLDAKLRELQEDPGVSISVGAPLNERRVAAWAEALKKRQVREARMQRALDGDETVKAREAAARKSRLTDEEEALVERLLANPPSSEEIPLDGGDNPFVAADTADVDARLAELARDHVAYTRLADAAGTGEPGAPPGTAAGSIAASALSTSSTATTSFLEQARVAREARDLKRREAEVDARLRKLKTTGDASGERSAAAAPTFARASADEVRSLAQKLLSELRVDE